MGAFGKMVTAADVTRAWQRTAGMRKVAALLGAAVLGSAIVVSTTRRSVGSQPTGVGSSGSQLRERTVHFCASRPQGAPQSVPSIVYPPGTIDGNKNPELIPDGVAYKMLFLSLLEPADTKLAQPARQKAKLRMIGLSAEDKASFLQP